VSQINYVSWQQWQDTASPLARNVAAFTVWYCKTGRHQVKLSLGRPCGHMESSSIPPSLLTSALDGLEWSASGCWCFNSVVVLPMKKLTGNVPLLNNAPCPSNVRRMGLDSSQHSQLGHYMAVATFAPRPPQPLKTSTLYILAKRSCGTQSRWWQRRQ
jgi:hypothetical protein